MDDKQKLEYQLKYQRTNLKQVKLTLNRLTDQGIIDHLGKQPNVRQYIIGLIKADMAKGQM